MARVDDRQTVSLQAKFAIDDFQGAPGGDDEAVRSACQTRAKPCTDPSVSQLADWTCSPRRFE